MLSVFKGAILSLFREKGLMFWALAFPLVLSSMFILMFSNLDDVASFSPIPCAVVTDENYEKAPAFGTMIEALSQEGDDQLLKVQQVDNEQAARALLEENMRQGGNLKISDNGVVGYYTINSEGEPTLHTASGAGSESMLTIYQSILKKLADNYLHQRSVIEDLAINNPAALSNPQTIEQLTNTRNATEQISLTHNKPQEYVRYYFALLGMSTLFCAGIALLAICRTQPNLSALGARRALGGIGRIQTLGATLFASWTLSFVCLVIAYLFIRLVAGVTFGERDAACIITIATAALFSTACGAFLGAIPRISESTKSGILTALSCLSALFAGLYGQPTMKLADQIAEQAPLLATLNPASQIAHALYSITYYDTYERLLGSLALLILSTVVLFALSALLVRRQRYAHL